MSTTRLHSSLYLVHNEVSALAPLLRHSLPLGKLLTLRDDRLASADASEGVKGGASDLESSHPGACGHKSLVRGKNLSGFQKVSKLRGES